MGSDITVRYAQRTDVRELSQVLGRAFFNDPVLGWLLPDADLRRRKLHHLFAALTRHHHLAKGACEVASGAGAVGAAALWDPPGKWQHTRTEELRQLPGLLLAFRSALRKGT